MAAATSKPKPASSRSFGARMTAKVGPLPVWAWALAILVVGYLVYRHSSASSSTSTSSTTDTSSGDATAPTTDTSTSGSPGPDQTGGSGGPDAASLNDSLLSQLAGFQGSIDALTAAVLSTSAFVPGGGDSGSGSQVPNGTTPPGPGTGTATAATSGGGTVKTTPHGATTKPAPTLVSEHGAGGGYTPARNVTYYTYRPGQAPKGKRSQEAPARGPSGTTLHFAAGRGYYYA